MWQMFIGRISVKCKHQNFCVQPPCLCKEFFHSRYQCLAAVIIGDHCCSIQNGIQSVGQFAPRSLHPPSARSVCGISWNHIIFDKSDEMIHPDYIKELCTDLHSSFPPGKPILLHERPVIQWISPYLTCFGKLIRNCSCHISSFAILIQ